MRKIFGVLVFVFFIGGLLMGCFPSSPETEYTMDEFLRVYKTVRKNFDKETAYWTEDDKKSKDYFETFLKCAEKEGLERGIVTIRGVKTNSSSAHFFCLVKKGTALSDKGKLDTNQLLPCVTNNSKHILIEDDQEVVRVKGFLFKNTVGLDDCEIISPDLSKFEFKNNIQDMIESPPAIEEKVIQGVVKKIISIETYKENNKYLGDKQFELSLQSATYVGLLESDDKAAELLFFLNKKNNYEIIEGDRLALRSTVLESSDALGQKSLYVSSTERFCLFK